jgi:hypothetical protein
MSKALDTIARMVAGDEFDRHCFPWEMLRYQHTRAIRARLLERTALALPNDPTPLRLLQAA